MRDLQDQSVMKHISAKLKTSSAVVPALLFSLIAMPIGASGLIFGPTHLNYIFSLILTLPLLVALYQIVFFTHFDRDRLHNEEHIERRMQIDRGTLVIRNNVTGGETVIEGKAVPSRETGVIE